MEDTGGEGGGEYAAYIHSLPNSVHKVHVDGNGEGSLTLNGLSNNNVFLVKANTTSTMKSFVNTVPLQSIMGETLSAASVAGTEGRRPAGTVTLGGKTLTRYERRWDITIPPEHNALWANRSVLRSFTEPTVGDQRNFYVDITNPADVFTEKSATLKKNGQYCRIWVVNENLAVGASTNNDNQITEAQIDALASKFDEIYPLETNLLGYEYGGGLGGNGGRDGDPKIQILLFDIDGDFSATHDHPDGMVLGYFYSGDEFQTTQNPYSNEAEIFYLDVEMLDAKPTMIYTTLIHEFNHMINFNVKVLQTGNFSNYETWYTEMLSMLAEDAIGPLVGIPYIPDMENGNVIIERIHLYWLMYYIAGVMQWNDSNPYPYYASNYAFGAYLVRNFGGPSLLSRIAKSNLGGRDSLDRALNALNKTVDGMPVNHTYALSRFGEALVYSGNTIPQYALSFDKTATGTVGGVPYTFPRFNIWDMDYTLPEDVDWSGPLVPVYDGTDLPMEPYSVQLYSKNEWCPSQTDSLTVNLSGEDLGVTYYLMVK